MLSAAVVSGWIAVALLLAAASVPVTQRLRVGRRAAPDSPPMKVHAVIGLTTSAAVLGHAITLLPALGSPAAIAGGMTALGPGVIAFFLLTAHVGVGLQLRTPRLRDRAAKRKLHVGIALAITAAVAAHVVALRVADRPRSTAAASP